MADNQLSTAVRKEIITEEASAPSRKKIKVSVQKDSTLKVTVPESAAVIKAIIYWLYKNSISKDSEILAEIYKAAQKYHIRELCDYIEI
jgi:hypothetical protein